MTPSRFAVGLVGLALAGLWYFAGGAHPLPATSAADASPRVAAPLAHENLSVYFVYGPDAMPDANVLSLSEALERELAVVHETSDVNTLAVENRSPDAELFIQSGDIVKGGKQDRMAQMDMLLPPMSGVVAMKAHCVEQGRWTGRGAEDAARFKSSAKCAVGNDMKIANYSGRQAAVWQTVGENQSKLRMNVDATVTANASPTSFQLALEAPVVQAKVAEYEAALRAAGADRAGVVGVVFVVNGQVTGAEVYGSCALFRKAWPKLLNAAAVEAAAERTDKATAAPPSAREVERFLAYGATAEPAGSGSPPARGQTMSNFVTINANEEMFQTEGRPPGEAFQTEGRGPGEAVQTEGRPSVNRSGQFILGGSVNSDVAITGSVQTEGRVAQQVDGQALANPAQPLALYRVHAPLRTPTLNPPNPAVDGAVALPAPPANPDGNRLSSNRQENRSTLVVESRDPTRQNAVIHRSYLKK